MTPQPPSCLVRSCVFIAVALQPAVAWWDNGHMLTAEIARQMLTKEEVETLDGILAEWEGDFPGACDTVTAAVWPDMLKCKHPSPICKKSPSDAVDVFDDWHFDNIPYNPDGIELPRWASEAGWKRDPSATWFLVDALETFGVSGTRFAFNLMSRFVIHIVGDLHQPLHTAEGFFDDEQYGHLLNGDQGGNLVHVKSDIEGVTNLHSLWDSGMGEYMLNWPPLDAGRKALAANASAIIAKFPANSSVFEGRYNSHDIVACFPHTFELTQGKHCAKLFEGWANESLELAIKYAYPGIHADGAVPAEYIRDRGSIIQQQLALGGYRLADILRFAVSRAPRVANSNASAPTSQARFWEALFIASASLNIFLVAVGLRMFCKRRKVGLLGVHA